MVIYLPYAISNIQAKVQHLNDVIQDINIKNKNKTNTANFLKLSETTHFSSSNANHVVLIMLQTGHDSYQTLGNIQHETRKVAIS